MRSHRIVVATALMTVLAAAAHGQPASNTALSPTQIVYACAPPPVTLVPSAHQFHVIGAQDTVPRSIFTEHDLLVLDAGTTSGMQLGQQYFLRRPVEAATYSVRTVPVRRAVQTAGWIRIVAANETTSVASIEHSCSVIRTGDYLEPFDAPAVASDASDAERSGEPDFTALSNVLFGDDERAIASTGDFMLIDRGSEQGVAPGARFAIYRDVHTIGKDYWAVSTARLPLAAVGEGVVVSTSPTMSVVQIVQARDAVRAGDVAAPRKK
jgi:hypothetical protein